MTRPTTINSPPTHRIPSEPASVQCQNLRLVNHQQRLKNQQQWLQCWKPVLWSTLTVPSTVDLCTQPRVHTAGVQHRGLLTRTQSGDQHTRVQSFRFVQLAWVSHWELLYNTTRMCRSHGHIMTAPANNNHTCRSVVMDRLMYITFKTTLWVQLLICALASNSVSYAVYTPSYRGARGGDDMKSDDNCCNLGPC